jgi:hypothetical protein
MSSALNGLTSPLDSGCRTQRSAGPETLDKPFNHRTRKSFVAEAVGLDVVVLQQLRELLEVRIRQGIDASRSDGGFDAAPRPRG